MTALWVFWATALGVVGGLLILAELVAVTTAFGSGPFKGSSRGIAVYVVPAMMGLLAAVGYLTVVWPALERKRRRRGGRV